MSSDIYSRRHKDQRAAQDADQTESAAILHHNVSADAGLFDDRVAGVVDDEVLLDVADREAWHSQDLSLDELVGQNSEEISRRADIMGEAYPFKFDKGTLKYTPSKTGFYEFCLATCCAPNITTGQYTRLPRTFERVVTVLMKGYMGIHADALHVGTPRDVEVGTKFQEAMATLHKLSGEWRWGPESGLPDVRNNSGDEGVDFIVWKKSLDKRPGQIFILGQCACGDDWDTKFSDTSLNRYEKWFNPTVIPEPLRAFATPFHLSDGNLREAQREAGLVFDRARLTLIAEDLASDPMMTPWWTTVEEAKGIVLTGQLN
ncbi:MAG: hypothetical protein ABF479_04860 [Gluconacetobacter sp.]|uniref:Uncharacterized protein n=1 Tax=Gluconacetobacter dulcium TaxID=2729096 RepID=A0A7W4PKH2_9PROT|nr:hypothetical protein [Gluconacetobacter dulcium]MBB2199614.1 hypothetical protein [Gluconacetobacter dulcium]